MLLSSENVNGLEIIKRIDEYTGGKLANGCSVAIEQYLFSTICKENHKFDDIQYLLDEKTVFGNNGFPAIANEICKEVGYTHLISMGPKQNHYTMQRLRKRIQEEYACYHDRIRNMVQKEREICG